jgi:guanylate kinase
LEYSISYTTRPPRPGEVDGRDYFFVDEKTFKNLISEDGFLEWVQAYNHYYGTSRDWVNQRLAAGQDVLVDVDVAGAKSLRSRFPKAKLIFMVPPSQPELIRRLTNRRTETSEQLARRLAQSTWEINQRTHFDFLVVNDDLIEATREVEGLVAGRPGRKPSDNKEFWKKFYLPDQPQDQIDQPQDQPDQPQGQPRPQGQIDK